jgi:Fe-S cluster assembly ATP-binding protein
MYERTQGTILIISHQERILDIADKVIVIANGELSAYGNKSDILPELLNAQSGCRFTKEAE